MIGDEKTSALLFKIHEITMNETNCEKSPVLINAFNIQIKEVIVLINEKLKQRKLI